MEDFTGSEEFFFLLLDIEFFLEIQLQVNCLHSSTSVRTRAAVFQVRGPLDSNARREAEEGVVRDRLQGR